jgi:type I restriction enzyme, S subunit
MSEARRTPKLRFPEFIEEWEEKRLGDISTNIMYGIGSAAIKYDGVNKYLRITDIDDSSRNFVPKPLTSPEGLIHNNYKLSDGDIVFARTGASVGKSYLYKTSDGNLIFAGFLIKFNIISANPYFVYSNTFRHYYDNWVSVMSVRSGQPGINAEEYKLLPIGLPTKPEQQQIALFLTSVDSKIEQLSKKQELLREYKKGLMQKIFSQAIRFKADDGSDYPDWEERNIDSLPITISDGNYGEQYPTSKDFKKTGVPFLRANNIKNLKVSENDMRYITIEQHNILTSGHLKTNDILITTRGEVGNIALVDDRFYNANINAQICLLRIDDSSILNYKYLLISLNFNSCKKQFKTFETGTALKQLPKGSLKKIKLNIPSLPEQQKIANFLSSIDNKLEQIVKQLDETKLFKKALLQQMFV